MFATSFKSFGVVEYGACGDKPAQQRLGTSDSIFATASASTARGSRRLRTPVISRKEKTRSGVDCQTIGRSGGTASMSATVVVPVRKSICAPSSQDFAKSE